MPRSGSTLVEQILSSHPDIYGAGEVKYLSRVAGPAARPIPVAAQISADDEKITPAQLDMVAKNYLTSAHRRRRAMPSA